MRFTVVGEDTDDPALEPPFNFSMVEDGIYRSSFPQPLNFSYIRTLNLRSIIYLCTEPYPSESIEFIRSQNIKLFQFGIEGKKEPSTSIPNVVITEALKILIDVNNHPVLIHCRQGKHRTGCLVGCLRKLQNWCMPSIHEEYRAFAGVKSRPVDLKFMEEFDVTTLTQCLYSIIYKYQGYGSRKRRLLHAVEDNQQKPRPTSLYS